ncbi:MAG: hypothetical protein PHT94_02520 [Candidatus Nanoarchaeia archaeon]|nr:hypothetical protein [Candidatus Nanoarchaeia archaeon]
MSSNEEIIGFHKGSLNTLLKEYNELSKMVNVVGSYINYHKNELEKLGVKIDIKSNQDSSNNQGNN